MSDPFSSPRATLSLSKLTQNQAKHPSINQQTTPKKSKDQHQSSCWDDTPPSKKKVDRFSDESDEDGRFPRSVLLAPTKNKQKAQKHRMRNFDILDQDDEVQSSTSKQQIVPKQAN